MNTLVNQYELCRVKEQLMRANSSLFSQGGMWLAFFIPAENESRIYQKSHTHAGDCKEFSL